VARNFEAQEKETIMVADIQQFLKKPFKKQIQIEEIEADRIEDLLGVQAAVWGESTDYFRESLVRELNEVPQKLFVYLASFDGEPVGASWMRIHPPTKFASLWGGSVKENFRGRGIYQAMVATRARKALEEGCLYLTVDAGAMSRPILERVGFEVLTEIIPCHISLCERSEAIV
jgi:predicted GNAT family acetyltransferase